MMQNNNALLESMSCGWPPLVIDLLATREYDGDVICFLGKTARIRLWKIY
jgi:hypothetical protein